MTGEGTVISVSDTYATVRICKSSACSHNCSECSACSNPSFETKVSNPVGASVGDRVLIEGSTGKVLGVSLIVYMLPVFLMIAASVVCDALHIGALYTVIVFAALLTVWFFIIKLVNRKIKPQDVIVQILKD